MNYFSRIERGLLSKKKSVLEDKELFHKIRNLPTLPFIVMKVMEVVNNPRSSANDLAKIIQTDQSLAAKVLRLVNSAYYGFPNPISTITHAVTILGFNTLRTLVLGISAHDMFSKRPGERFDRKELWLHSVATAIGAKALARRTKYPNQEEMFLAGLLHDVGKIILDQYVHVEFVTAIETSKNRNVPLYEVEREALGAHHGEVGKYIGDLWKLPPVLTEAIRWHHEVDQAPPEHQKIAAIVHAANQLARLLKLGNSGDHSQPAFHPVAHRLLDLEHIGIEELSNELRIGVRDCKAFLELDEPPPDPNQPPKSNP